MDIKIRGGEIILRHKLKKNETYRITEGSKFKSLTIMKKPQVIKGFSNECEDGLGIITIDYDGVDKSVVTQDYKYIQKKFKLPRGYLFQTKKDNFHVVCLKKFKQSDIAYILQHTRCDNNYKTMPLRNPYRCWVLRLGDKKGSKKPKFVGTIGDDVYSAYKISSAHLTLLNNLYPKTCTHYPNKDKLKILKSHIYETGGI